MGKGTTRKPSKKPGPGFKIKTKKEKQEDTIAEDEDGPVKKKDDKKSSSAEGAKPRTPVARSKEKERTSKEKRKPSAEVTEKEKESPGLKISLAAKALCKYLIDMKEPSLSTYFDEHLAKYQPADPSAVDWEKNMSKNRSKEFKLLDKTRVHLTQQSPEDCEYINASVVKFDQSETEFIMTQFPLPDTVRDFWRMVSQKKALRVITVFEPYVDEAIEEWNKIPSVMQAPTATTSGGEQAAGEDGKTHTREQIVNNSVRCESTTLKSFFPLFSEHYMNLNGWLINTQRIEIDERDKSWVNYYSIEVVAESCSEASYVRLFNCTTWPWKKVPGEEKKLLALTRAPWKDMAPGIKASDPVVVMCDLGLDRSATVVLTAILIELVLAGKPPDCDALFRKMRDQRAGCFTLSMFYSYAIRAALIYLKLKFRQMTDVTDDIKPMIDNDTVKANRLGDGVFERVAEEVEPVLFEAFKMTSVIEYADRGTNINDWTIASKATAECMMKLGAFVASKTANIGLIIRYQSSCGEMWLGHPSLQQYRFQNGSSDINTVDLGVHGRAVASSEVYGEYTVVIQ
uniref:Tyrosine-protein phosphatase domain-containing protein n=1 Tax=Caenorhabditis tropicalis TaxID=1561998 RepID=A0A1I7T5Y9_9PELO